MSTKPNPATELPLPELSRAWRPLLAEALANDLAGFVRAAWPILLPNRKLVWSWHYDLLCEYLVLVKQRKLQRLVINVPPRTLKSPITTVLFPTWVWLTEPGHHFLTASYSRNLSGEHAMARRTLMQNAWFRKLWGDRFRLAGGRNRVEQYMNNRGGQMLATSVEATTMGRGCDTAILDDIISANQAASDAERTHANNWIDSTLYGQLNEPAVGSIIVVMQRLHQLDPTGFLLQREPHVWTKLCIPLVAEGKETWVFPISGRIVHRNDGDVLMADRFPPSVVEQYRLRRDVFATQCQQRPAPAGENLIKRDEVRYYGGIDPRTGQQDEKLPRTFDSKIISVDCAFKDSPSSDFVAILVIGVRGSKRFILNAVNAHLDAAGTEAAIRRQRELHSPINAVLIEDRANGPAVIQRLKINVPGVIAINPEGGKNGRMQAAAFGWQAGDWYVDRNAAWTEPLVEQITVFPNAAHDDLADAMSQAACWLAKSTGLSFTMSNAFTGEIYLQVHNADLRHGQ